MKSLSINKGQLHSEVNLPSSKSYANRVLILAALYKNSPSIHNLPKATDVTNLLHCLQLIGLQIEKKNDELRILNSFPACETHDLELDVGDGGTTARFLAAMLLLGKKTYTLKLGKRLKDRPWQEFLDISLALGAKVKLVDDKLTIQGPVTFPSMLEIDCSHTTQFATAFQLIAIESKTKIVPINLKSSISYWHMTEKIVKDFKNADRYSIPLDWSSASYPLAFGALNQKITFPGLKADDNQSDSKFLNILQMFDAISFSDDQSVIVNPFKKTLALKYDVSDALDLVPALAFFLAHIPGKHELTGVKNLIHKESNRLDEVIKLLNVFGKSASSNGSSLFIEGNEKRLEQKVQLELVDDHRMVMTGTLFLLHHVGGTIHPATAVEKSYPEFFDLIISS